MCWTVAQRGVASHYITCPRFGQRKTCGQQPEQDVEDVFPAVLTIPAEDGMLLCKAEILDQTGVIEGGASARSCARRKGHRPVVTRFCVSP